MGKPIEISVIVPVYKGIRFLREATDSLRGQTFADWECILVDDGSKDGSGALADEIASKDPRFVVIHQTNGGTSVARNAAMRIARGTYLAFLDEDDAYHPEMLATLHSAILSTGADVVGCEFTKFPEDAHPSFDEPIPATSSWMFYAGAEIAEAAADYYDGIPFEIWRNLYRREVVGQHLFPDGVRVEQDLYWMYTLLPKIRKYVRIPWHGYHWRASSIGGFLHPDPKSLISWTKTSQTVLRVLWDDIKLTEEQKRRFVRAMSLNLEENILVVLRGGLRLTFEESRAIRAGLRSLSVYGVEVGQALRPKKRFLWRMFMLTGSTWWIRK